MESTTKWWVETTSLDGWRVKNITYYKYCNGSSSHRCTNGCHWDFGLVQETSLKIQFLKNKTIDIFSVLAHIMLFTGWLHSQTAWCTSVHWVLTTNLTLAGWFSWLVLFEDPQDDEVQFFNTASWLYALWPVFRPDLTLLKDTLVTSLVTQNFVRFPTIGNPDDVITVTWMWH